MGYTETQIFVDWLNGCMSTCIDSSLWWDNEDKDYVDDDDDSCNKTLTECFLCTRYWSKCSYLFNAHS